MKRSDLSDCAICKGTGEYKQTYTSGCGGGSFQSTGPCGYCNGFGLVLVKSYNNETVKLKLDNKK